MSDYDFFTEFSTVEGQEKYFLVSIKILTCCNRTCKNSENQSKNNIAKMSFE